MRLELCWSDVGTVVPSAATRLAGWQLEVDLDRRRALLSAGVQLTDLRLDLVHPGERCRIGGVIPLAPDVAHTAAGRSPVGPREASA